MLGGVFVQKFDCFVQIFRLKSLLNFPELCGDFFARQNFELFFDFDQRFRDDFFARRDQQNLAVSAVFGLRQQIGGDKRRNAGFVRQNRDFRRSGGHINRRSEFGDLLFGFGDELVAGTENFINFRARFRAESHRADGLRAADFENFRRAAQARAYKSYGVDFAVCVGRRADDDFAAAGDLAGTASIKTVEKSGAVPAGM
jgi:hypothetical protein